MIRKKIKGGISQGGIVQGGMIQTRRAHQEAIMTGEPVRGKHVMPLPPLLNLHLAMTMPLCLAILMLTVGPPLMMLLVQIQKGNRSKRCLWQRDLGGRANVKLAVKMRRLISGRSTRS